MSTAAAPRAIPNKWFVLVLVCIAQFMVVLDATVVNVALPSIQEDLGFSAGSLQWVVNAYTLVFGGFLLLGGRAADFVGRKRLFIAGVVVFTAASALAGFATSSEFLIVARALQGLGAAMVSPAALSIVTTTFKDGPERAKALSVWAAIAVGGAAVGLLLGGVLTEYLAWEWIFFVNVPVGAAAGLLSLRYIAESKVATSGVDVLGALSVTAGLTLLVFAIVRTQEYGWLAIETIGLAVASAVLLTAFVLIERRSKAPLVRLEHLPHPVSHQRQRRDARGGGRHVRRLLLRLALRAGHPRLHAGRGGPGLPAADRRDHPVLGRRPAARRPRGRELGGDGRHDDRGRRADAALAGAGGRQLRRRRPAGAAGDVGRPGPDLRAAHADRHHQRGRQGRRARLGPVQLVAADRRGAGPGDPLDGRGQHDHRLPAGGRAQRRRAGGGPGRTATRWRSRWGQGL